MEEKRIIKIVLTTRHPGLLSGCWHLCSRSSTLVALLYSPLLPKIVVLGFFLGFFNFFYFLSGYVSLFK